MSDILRKILDVKREEIARAKAREPYARLLARAESRRDVRDFEAALRAVFEADLSIALAVDLVGFGREQPVEPTLELLLVDLAASAPRVADIVKEAREGNDAPGSAEQRLKMLRLHLPPALAEADLSALLPYLANQSQAELRQVAVAASADAGWKVAVKVPPSVIFSITECGVSSGWQAITSAVIRSRTWSASVEGRHFWTPALRSALGVAYLDYRAPTGANVPSWGSCRTYRSSTA